MGRRAEACQRRMPKRGPTAPTEAPPQPNWQEDRAVPSAILRSAPPPQTAAAGTKRARGRRARALSDGIAVMAYNLLSAAVAYATDRGGSGPTTPLYRCTFRRATAFFSSEFVSVSHKQRALLVLRRGRVAFM